MIRNARSRLPIVFLSVLLSLPGQARVQDYTLDFNSNIQPEGIESRLVPFFDSWNHFLGRLNGFDQVQSWGLTIDGEKPLQKSEANLIAPASVQKLVTTASALRNLGSDAQYTNTFEGQIDSDAGVLLHPKFTVSGDPTWGHEAFEDIRDRLLKVITELKNQNVSQVRGPILVNAIHPELDQISRPEAWPKKWTLQCMATQMSAFMFNGNCGVIEVKSLTEAIWLTPGVDLPISLQLRKASANNLVITPTLDERGRITRYLISGSFAKPTSTFYDPLQGAYLNSVPVHLSTKWLKNVFTQMLGENQIVYIPEKLTDEHSAGSRNPIFVDLSSLPLLSVLRVAVPQSINAVLDRTFYEVAFHENTSQPSDPSYRILRENVAADDLFKGIVIFDGSGLVDTDRLRSDLLSAFLTQVEKQPYFADYLSTLAVAGETGTLAGRLTGPLTKGKIFAKTGTLDGTYNLAGYFQSSDSTYEAFSILSQSSLGSSQVRGMIDKIATQFAYFNTPQASVHLR